MFSEVMNSLAADQKHENEMLVIQSFISCRRRTWNTQIWKRQIRNRRTRNRQTWDRRIWKRRTRNRQIRNRRNAKTPWLYSFSGRLFRNIALIQVFPFRHHDRYLFTTFPCYILWIFPLTKRALAVFSIATQTGQGTLFSELTEHRIVCSVCQIIDNYFNVNNWKHIEREDSKILSSLIIFTQNDVTLSGAEAAGCLPYTVGKQPSMPLIILGKWTLSWVMMMKHVVTCKWNMHSV